MTDDAAARRQRSQSSLRGVVRYEDAQQGILPRTGKAGASTLKTSPSSDTHTFSPPRTSPRADDVASLPSHHDIKRDSGIAPSISTTDGAASSLSVPSTGGGGGVAREPNLPTIVVNDELDDTLSPIEDRSRSRKVTPFAKRKVVDIPQRQAKSAPPPRTLNRMESFKGIQASLPTTSADDIDLDDLTSDKITFSQRGSLMFGGKKMQDLIAAQGKDMNNARTDGVTSPVPAEETEVYPQEQTPAKEENSPIEVKKDSPQSVTEVEPPRKGLVAGRRQPSVHMLQAAIQGGRVLSAEEITFSMKVRSMYDHGDERAADWVTSLDGHVSGKTTPEPGRDSTTPDMLNGDLTVNKTRRPASSRSSQRDPRASFYSRETTELAGGIEDWDEVDSRNVDRYGFIHPDRAASGSRGSHENRGMQRVATSLRVEAAHSRRDRGIMRRPSSARSSRSMPAGGSDEATYKRGPVSVHSAHSTSTRTNPFRSRTRRVLAEAPDMLSPPPDLGDIAETEDAGTTASSRKQREWAREEKWQKMARPVSRDSDGKGGGMRFDFDTSDPKLIERTWKGIPDRWRATAWHSFLSSSARKRNSPTTDEELIGQFHKLQGESSADDVQIDVDVPRTINLHVMFRRRYRGGQRLLFRVLHAVSLYFPDTGYVQGMAALAVTLLCYYDEEKAFVMMVRMWQLRGLEELFQSGLSGLFTCLKEFEDEWLQGGEVATRLSQLSIENTAWGTRWYLTLFNMSMPFPAQLRVWDVFMLLGDAPSNNVGSFGGADLDILHATSAALIDAMREILLDSDFENAMKVLTSFVPIKDEDLLMRVARTEWKMKKRRAPGGGGAKV